MVRGYPAFPYCMYTVLYMLININSVSMGIVTTIIDNTKLRQIIIAYLKGIQVAKEKYATYSGRLKE